MGLGLLGEKIWQRLQCNFIETFAFKMNILLEFLDVLLQVVMWFFLAKIIDPETLGYGASVGYMPFIFIGTIALFFFAIISEGLQRTFTKDSSSNGIYDLVYLSNTNFFEYFIVFFAINIIERFFMFLIPAIFAFGLLYYMGGGDWSVFHLGPENLLVIVVALLIFVIGSVGLGLMSLGSRLFFRQGDPTAFIVMHLNNFFSGTSFPISVLPAFLLFIPKILPSAFIVMMWRDTIFLNKTLLSTGTFQLIIISLFVNIILLGIGSFIFSRGIYRSKVEGRWLSSADQ